MTAPVDIDLFAAVRAHLGASTTATEPAAGVHLARARSLFERATAELKLCELALLTREAEWAAGHAPVQQMLVPPKSKHVEIKASELPEFLAARGSK